MKSFWKILIESSDVFGRNMKQRKIFDKLDGKVAAEYVATVKTRNDAYDLIFAALKRATGSQNLGKMSTPEGYRDALKKIQTELDKAIPNTFKKSHLSALTKNKISLAGFGSFSLSDNFDIADYLSAVVLKSKGMIDPDDHKAWFKK